MMKVRLIYNHTFVLSVIFPDQQPKRCSSVFFILLQLNNIDVNETVEGDDRAFEIWHEREDSVRKYTLQARTVNIKNSWLRDLRELQQRFSMPAWSELNTHTHTFSVSYSLFYHVFLTFSHSFRHNLSCLISFYRSS